MASRSKEVILPLFSHGTPVEYEHSSDASKNKKDMEMLEQVHKVEKRIEAPPLWGQAEKVGAFHSREETVT